MNETEVWAAVAQEREVLADLLTGVSPAAWTAPSRCEGWSVKDVVAHLVVLAEASAPSIYFRHLRADVRPQVAVSKLARQTASTTAPDELVRRLRAAAGGRFVVTGMPPTVALGEVLVHRADVAGAAELPVHPADERLAAVLEAERRLWFAFGVPRAVRRVRFVPTDADWTVGPDDGALVTGPGEALLLVATGREVETGMVSGPGVALLGG